MDRLLSMLAASHFSLLCERYALSAQTSPPVLSVVTMRRSTRPSASAAEVTAAARMKPNRRSMVIWLF